MIGEKNFDQEAVTVVPESAAEDTGDFADGLVESLNKARGAG